MDTNKSTRFEFITPESVVEGWKIEFSVGSNSNNSAEEKSFAGPSNIDPEGKVAVGES